MNVRPCGIPECRICRWNEEEHQDSGHPTESLAELALGAAALVAWFVLLLVVLPVIAS